MEQSRVFASSRPFLYRQSLHLARRVTEIDPHNLIAHAWLADLLTVLGHPEESLNTLQQIRRDGPAFGLNATNELDLLRIEATAHFRSGAKEKGKNALDTALRSPAVRSVFRSNAAQLFLQNGMASDAVPLLKKNSEEDSTDIASLSNLGFAYMNLEKHELARDAFTKALELDPKSAIPRINRAITQLRLKNYDAAYEDYQVALLDFPNAYQVRFGLGEIAEVKKDTATAISHYEACLKAAQPGTPDFLLVSNRLATLRAPGQK
jgi:tetratricopeptide (TPR) repeat protein